MELQQETRQQKAAIGRLTQQNEKLRAELSELANQLEKILQRNKQSDQRPNFNEVDQELGNVRQRANKYKKEAQNLRLQLNATSDTNLVELMNESKYLKRQLRQLTQEQKTLQKIQQEQEKALTAWTQDQNFEKKSKQLQAQIKEQKEKYRVLKLQMNNEEVQWRQNHGKMIQLRERIREHKNKSRKTKEQIRAEEQETKLSELKRKLQIMEKSKRVEETKGNRRVQELESQIKAIQDEITLTDNKIKEKEQEGELQNIKIRQLKNTLANFRSKNGQQEDSKMNDEFSRQLASDLHDLKGDNNGQNSSVFSKPKLDFQSQQKNDNIEDRPKQVFRDNNNKEITLPIYRPDDDIQGAIRIDLRRGKRLEHQGIKIELFGRIGKFYLEISHERNQTSEFLSMSREIEPQGIISESTSIPFSFNKVEKQFETYVGRFARLRYILKATIGRNLASNIVREQEFAVQIPTDVPDTDTSIKMEVGIEECLHIEFEYNKHHYHLKDIITGKVYFLLVRIRIKYMEVTVVRRETIGAGQSAIHENETVGRYEVMDGAPVRGENIPIRVFLESFKLGPTMVNVNNKFSVRYFINLVLVDEEDRRYFKQQEITIFRQIE